MRAKDFLTDGLMRPTTYKGWTYKTYDEDYDDVIKISHVAKKGDKEVSVDWSPYNEMTSKDFALWIDLGMPTRDDVGSVGPLTHDDLMTLANTKQGTHKLLQKEDSSVEEVKDPAKYLSKKLSDIETQKKFAKGEIRIPTPQERRAEIEKRKKEQELGEETKKDACYHKVKSRYKVWPSAYASGALVQCRKKGAKNWGNKSK